MDVLYLHTIINQINFMRRILSFAAMAAILVLGASCEGTEPENGDNGSNTETTETPETPTDPVEAVSGDYTGTLNISYKLSADGEANSAGSGLTNAITISKTENAETVDILVKQVTVLNIPFGDVTISGCTVTEADGSYNISGQVHMDVTVGGNSIPCDIAATGTVKDGKLTLDLVATITLPAANTPAQDIVGTYSGLLDVSLSGFPIVTDMSKDIKIVLTDNSTETVDLVVEDLTLTIGNDELALGTISVTGCNVTKDNDAYSFASDGSQIITVPGEIGDCEVSTTGSVTGNNISVTLNITWNKLPIVVTFEGTFSTSTSAE